MQTTLFFYPFNAVRPCRALRCYFTTLTKHVMTTFPYKTRLWSIAGKVRRDGCHLATVARAIPAKLFFIYCGVSLRRVYGDPAPTSSTYYYSQTSVKPRLNNFYPTFLSEVRNHRECLNEPKELFACLRCLFLVHAIRLSTDIYTVSRISVLVLNCLLMCC